MAASAKKISPYETWYEFKKELEKNLGCILLNWRWLEVKPKAPLPWDNSHMQVAVSTVTTWREQKAKRRQKSDRQLQHLIRHGRKHLCRGDSRRRNSCEEWSDCYTCPIEIDECVASYLGNQPIGQR